MSLIKLHQLFFISLATFLSLAVCSESSALDNSASALPATFPGLEPANSELSKLNSEIKTIEANFEIVLTNSRKQLSKHYVEKLDALDNEQRDRFESPAEFKVRKQKSRDELINQRDAELADLNVAKVPAKDTAPLKARIKQLTEHLDTVGPEGIQAELGEFDLKKHQFAIKFRGKFSILKLNQEGYIPLKPDEAVEFKKQWQSVLIRTEAKVTIDGDLVDLSLISDSDQTRWFEIDDKFFSLATLKTFSPDTLNALFPIGRTFKDCPECPNMVVLPAGNFDMGAKEGVGEASPVHRVSIGLPFAMGKTEVTQGEWKAVMGNNPGNFKNCGDTCPVEQVSWNDAKDFVQKLNAQTGRQYRLPSEAEWEYACRAGAQQKYCGGDKVDDVAWYSKNSGDHPHPVAAKLANTWDMRDMSGNLWEWVEDSFHADYAGAPIDGTAWQGDGTQRVLRGGSWSQISELVGATVRSGAAPALRDYYYGFRVARMLP